MRTADQPAPIRALRRIGLRVEAFAEAADFYRDVWGLSELECGTDLVCLRGSGPEHHILELVPGAQNGIDHIAFAVSTPRDVDAWARYLADEKVDLVTEPGHLEGPGGGYGFRFQDPEHRVIEISTEVEAVPERPADAAPVPIGLTHVVLNTADIDAAAAFYTDVLGFRVSDWSEHQMVFLRCNRYHHAIAFNRGEWASVNHMAYEMSSVDAFMRGLGRLRHHGIDPLWGPGRHGPGNNTFGYFSDPAGLVCEYTSEVTLVDEDTWVPRVWRRVPELTDLWGTSGPPSAETRRHMAGVPDPGPIAHRDDDAHGA